MLAMFLPCKRPIWQVSFHSQLYLLLKLKTTFQPNFCQFQILSLILLLDYYSIFAAVVQVSLVRSYTILFQIITFIKSYYSRELMLLAVNFADSYEVNRSLLFKSPSKYSCSSSSSCNNSSCVISLLLSLRYSEYLEK